MLFQDARDYQIGFLSLFLLLGVFTRDWTLQASVVLVAIATSLLSQWLWLLLLKPEHSSFAASWRSALITSLGLSLLLRVDSPFTMALAASLAIASKFLFQINGKHWFNPANFGIIAVLCLTHDAWVSPGQWGEEGWYALLFAGAGGLVLKRVGRWDTTIAFLGSYAGLEALRNFWLGWTWDVYGHRLISGSLLLFALFMVTDPRAIPNARIGRCLWAIAIASLTFFLRNYYFLSTAMFWALFVLSPLTVFCDRLWPAERYQWQPQPEAQASDSISPQVSLT